jgi:hypothetical protein
MQADLMAKRLRSAAHVASLSYWRWRRFQRSLTFDPDAISGPLPEPEPNDFLMCGSPRSGTSLVCAALFQPPDSITVMEPWDGMRLPPRDLFDSIRRELADTGHLARGKLDVGRLLEAGSVRWCGEGEARVKVDALPALIGVKWPAFWRYLDRLPTTKFVVCLRHPVEVIASYRTTGGSLGEGFDYTIPFNRHMNEQLRTATRSAAVRRILLYDYINAKLLPHLSRSNVFVLRYERWFHEPQVVLEELGAFLGVDVSATHVKISPAHHSAEVPAEDLDLIRRHCRTMEALGYRV